MKIKLRPQAWKHRRKAAQWLFCHAALAKYGCLLALFVPCRTIFSGGQPRPWCRSFWPIAALQLALTGIACQSSHPPPTMEPQFPSPMADSARRHLRLSPKAITGASFLCESTLGRPVRVYIPEKARASADPPLLLHFHGAPFIPAQCVDSLRLPVILVVVNLGSGSSAYERPFLSREAFPDFLASLSDSIYKKQSIVFDTAKIYISSFSAGYGAVRAILRWHAKAIAGLLLLDGLHTDYVPERRVLAKGGRLNAAKLTDFVQFARLATLGRKRMVITHSEIFPGTYASTTETADYILQSLKLQRSPVLKWGPGGMQLLSQCEQGRLHILGFAGNSAPDHMDHLHGMAAFLALLFH